MGAAGGIVGGLFANQKEGATNQGNMFVTPQGAVQNQAVGSMEAGYNNNIGDYQNQVGNGSITGQLFGSNGVMGNQISQMNDLQNNGFNLTDTDKTAYGQASGNIARQFGQNDQSLSQALSARGLSNSGAAGAAFSNSLGNKNEQLAGLQTQIAQNRMQMNQQRLAQQQAFISQLGGLGNQATTSAAGIGQQAANIGNQYLQGAQGQSNEQLSQMQQTAHASGLSNMIQGGVAGDAADRQMGSSMMSSAMSGASSMGGGAAMMSDRRVKVAVHKLPVSKYCDVPEYSFMYADPKHGEGIHTGVMAQDLLEKNPSHPAVFLTPDGYAVDYSKVELK